MSAAAAAPHSDGEDEEEYRQPTKRLKTADRETEEREEGEEELEEGEDSDSGSLPGDGESAVDHRARWTSKQYRGGRKVTTTTNCLTFPYITVTHCASVRALPFGIAVAVRVHVSAVTMQVKHQN